MDNIVDLIKEQHVNDQPTPTEKSQIVINFNTATPTLVLRFNSVKKGEKEYARLCKAWHAYSGPWDPKKQPPNLHSLDGDMFIAAVELGGVASIAFVDHSVRAKFVPA